MTLAQCLWPFKPSDLPISSSFFIFLFFFGEEAQVGIWDIISKYSWGLPSIHYIGWPWIPNPPASNSQVEVTEECPDTQRALPFHLTDTLDSALWEVLWRLLGNKRVCSKRTFNFCTKRQTSASHNGCNCHGWRLPQELERKMWVVAPG